MEEILSQEQRIARHKDFLRANVEKISAFSWENYLEKGAGAVLVPEEDFIYAAEPELKKIRFYYHPVVDRDKEPFERVLGEKELNWLSSYDPDEKVVLCVLREEGGVSSYLFGGMVKPSLAYAGMKAKSN